MVKLLQDKDRIFQNLYGLQDQGLEAAQKRGAWIGTSAMIEQGRDWVIDQIKPLAFAVAAVRVSRRA